MTQVDAWFVLAMRALVLLGVAAVSTAVVLVRDPTKQTIAVCFYGLLLALMFLLFQAPDVALAQIVVGAIALPLMILLALVKMRRTEIAFADREKSEKES